MKKKIEAIIKELKQYPREPKSLTWIESVLEKHLQEPTEQQGADVEDGIRCEIWGYWKDGICYVTDCINKRVGE